jgi:predicted TIM-barrel fold metal-dependent hydrolase
MISGRIDVHHHMLPAQYVQELANVGVVESGGVAFPHWTPEDSLAAMDRNGTHTALLSVSSPGLCFGNAAKNRDGARALNEFAAACVRHWPERFGFFATLPLPDVEAAHAEIAYALDMLHADGIGLLSNYAGVYLGDPRFETIFAELDRRAGVVYIHPTVFTGSEIPAATHAGSPIPTLPGFMLEFVFDTTRTVANLVLSGTVKRYPHIRFIISHAGGTIPFVAHKIVTGALLLAGSDKMIRGDHEQEIQEEVFRQLQGFYYDIALSANGHALSSLQQLVPPSQILWGSDYPMAPEWITRSTVHGITTYTGFSEQDRQKIASDNALKLFPRLQTQK